MPYLTSAEFFFYNAANTNTDNSLAVIDKSFDLNKLIQNCAAIHLQFVRRPNKDVNRLLRTLFRSLTVLQPRLFITQVSLLLIRN